MQRLPEAAEHTRLMVLCANHQYSFCGYITNDKVMPQLYQVVSDGALYVLLPHTDGESECDGMMLHCGAQFVLDGAE